MLETLTDFLEQAKKNRDEGIKGVAQTWIVYWLFLLWFHSITREKFFRRIEVRLKTAVEASHAVLACEVERAREIERTLRERQQYFFSEILPVQDWPDVAKGLHEPNTSDYHKLIRQYLSVKEPLPTQLLEPESVLLKSDGSEGVLSLFVSASSAEYAYFAQEVVGAIYQRYGEGWENSEIDFQVFHKAAEDWLANEYKKQESAFSRQCIEQFRKFAEDALAPMLLCHFAFWIRKSELPSSIWESFCTPEVIQDVCRFVLVQWRCLLHRTGTMVMTEKRDDGRLATRFLPQVDLFGQLPLRDLSRRIIEGLSHLVDEKSEHLTFRFRTQGGKELPSDATPKIIMKRKGGLTALALLTLLQEEKDVQRILAKKEKLDEPLSDTEAALLFFLPPMESSKILQKNDDVEFLQSLKQEAQANPQKDLLEQLLDQALTREIADLEETYRSAEYIWALLSTQYGCDIQEEIKGRISRAYFKRGRKALSEGLDPLGLAQEKLHQIVCEFPWSEWKRSGKRITAFIVEKIADEFFEEYKEELKLRQPEPFDSVTDKAPGEDEEENGMDSVPGESSVYSKISETVRDWFEPKQLRKLDQIEVNRLYIAILRNSHLKPTQRKVLTTFLRECRYGYSGDDVEAIHRYIRRKLRISSPGNFRQIKNRALDVVGLELRALLHERLAK